MRCLPLLVLATVLSSSFAATAADIRFDLKAFGDEKNKTSGVALDIPIVETGSESFPIDWDATIGIIASQARSGSFKDGGTEAVAVADGNAGYIVLGVQGRKLILTDIIEAVVRADYAAQVRGSGELQKYNPNGGVNLAAGANVILGEKKKLLLGATINRNLENKSTSMRIVLGGRF